MIPSLLKIFPECFVLSISKFFNIVLKIFYYFFNKLTRLNYDISVFIVNRIFIYIARIKINFTIGKASMK
jgi:hypothetical protein